MCAVKNGRRDVLRQALGLSGILRSALRSAASGRNGSRTRRAGAKGGRILAYRTGAMGRSLMRGRVDERALREWAGKWRDVVRRAQRRGNWSRLEAAAACARSAFPIWAIGEQGHMCAPVAQPTHCRPRHAGRPDRVPIASRSRPRQHRVARPDRVPLAPGSRPRRAGRRKRERLIWMRPVVA